MISQSLNFHTMQTLILLFGLTTLVTGQSTLKLVNLLYRHGDRSPIEIFPTDTNRDDKWPQGRGWLTTIGMQQHYTLGGWLRRRYVDTGYLSKDYKNTEIIIHSSDVSRCLMSAYCNLAGLYPPGPDRVFNASLNWQPIPVHTRPTSEDNTLSMRETCPVYMKLFNESFYLPDIQKEEKENKDFYAWLGHHTGVDHEDLRNIWEIGDTLLIEKTHNLTLPPWLNNTVYEKIRSLVDYQWSYRFKTKQMERLKGGPLLGEFLENMEDKIKVNSSNTYKMYMYSAHDSTVAALLRVLQVFNGVSPPYAAMVIMELHQNTSGQNFVKLYYKNSTTDSDAIQDVSIPNCDNECPLQKFIALNKPMTPTPSEWLQECGLSPAPSLSPTKAAVTCFACNDVTNLKYCDHIQRCHQDEVCYVSRTRNADGRIRYRSGCIQQQHCVSPHVGSTLTPQTNSCLQCCANDFCNQAGCGDQGFQDRTGRGPLCLDCSHVGNKDDCDNIKLCASNQACKVEEYIWGDNERLFKMGCEDKLTCAFAGGLRRKRSAPVCSSCCDDDFCNRNCTAGPQLSLIG